MGNAFKLPGLQKFLQQNLQIEVDRLGGFGKVTATAAQQSPTFADNVMSFSVAYGLAVQGLGLAAVNSNLLPLEITKTVLWRKKQPWFAAAAACLMLTAVSVWVGNVLANGQIDRAMGNLTDATAIRPRDIEQAEQVLANPGTEAAVEKAAKISGAAQTLQSALADIERKRSGDTGALKSMAKLPENNLIIPRIVDTIHRAFDQARPPELKSVKSGRDYAQFAAQSERAQRRDFWIERLQVIYDASDAATPFRRTVDDQSSGSSKAGWAIQLTCATTDARPAKWIEGELIVALDKLGKAPNRGFYFDTIRLAKVAKKPLSGTSDDSALDETQTGRPRGGARGGGGPRGGGGAPGGGARGAGGGLLGGGGLGGGARGGGGLMGGGGAAGGSGIDEDVLKFRERMNREDAVTGESLSEDYRFILEIVVAKGNTPANKIPDEYKPKKPGETKSADEKKKGA
jgi:hypothetical protein